ncbi:hypothetical protein SK803_44910 [Lentzea sp. BCCO 10_0856]|uniref:Tetratricopeptide repeat-containing protein n=1 Tax=Lentzea miocenica TaxID=3095431 RepID=A0ABU4TGR9_9PSEU|nr:hypothetical protein [Lentzea sp. BCCO 10_0856]MDX8037380.1 hypothetical protein [Lentzea sp. BCCO 10_0856]
MDDSDADDGLAFAPRHDWAPDIVRAAAGALEPPPLDLGRRAFALEPEAVPDRLGDRLAPHDDGLRTGTGGDWLSDDLARLREHEADLKLRGLLDKAEQALREERHADAWEHVEAALGIAPATVAALVLGVRCQHVLGEYETVLDRLIAARPDITDDADVKVVAQLVSTCELRLVDQVSEEADGLLDGDELDEAVEYVEQRVSRHPEVAGLHYVHGAVLYQTGQFPRALEVVEAARGADPEMFEDLYLAIQAKLCAPRVEHARQSLRAGEPKTAIEHLVACGEMLYSDSRYELLWSYAHERYAKSSKVPFVGWRRTRRAGVPPLSPAELQDVLGWVLAEEFNAGVTALGNQDFTATSTHCARAEAIDARCGVIAYLHATAETFAAQEALDRIDLGTLAVAERHLTRAAGLVPLLASDPELVEQRRWLEARVKNDLTDIARLARFIRCVTRFNDLMTRYERRTITTRNELYSVRGELISIRSEARISRKEHASDPSALRTLDNLLAALDHNLRQLLV